MNRVWFKKSVFPVLHYILSPGAMLWIFLFMLVNLVRLRKYRLLLMYASILMVWFSVLLGPCILVRYVVFLFFGLPLFVAEMDVISM